MPDAGVRVHAVCPQGVRTQMPSDSGPAGKELMQESAIEADDVAAALLAAIEAEQFLVRPHREVGAMYAGRAADPDRWLRGDAAAEQVSAVAMDCVAVS